MTVARNIILAVLVPSALGGIAATAFAPLYLVPVGIVALSLLSALTFGAASVGRSIAVGWGFGFGFFVIGLQWLTESFSVDADRVGAYAIPALLSLSGLLAVFPAIACGTARALRSNSPTANAFAISAAWTGSEMLRSAMFGGFPWNQIAHFWSISTAAMQIVSFVGSSGLTFVTFLAAAIVVPGTALPGLGRRIVHSGAIFFAIFIVGETRLFLVPDPGTTGKHIRIVQGNVPQIDKWQAGRREAILSRYIEMSGTPAAPRLSAIVWPETAVPYDLVADVEVRARIAAILPEDVVLYSGTLRTGEDRPTEIFNSIVAFGRDGGLRMVYDKVRLVPFGEYVPLRSLIPLQKLTAGSMDLSPGHVTGTFAVPPLPNAAPIICYEAIFPIVGTDDIRPQWILNVTNDAWFGRSAGPYQHLEIARYRSVEHGLPMVRAANTGISALVDPFGRVIKSIPLEVTGVIDFELPQSLGAPTPYSVLGDRPVILTIVIVLFGAAVSGGYRKITCRRAVRPTRGEG